MASLRRMFKKKEDTPPPIPARRGKKSSQEQPATERASNEYVPARNVQGSRRAHENPDLEVQQENLYEELRVPEETFKLVVAIDFGTAASGYAYSYSENKDNVIMNKNWGAEMGMNSFKAPTCVAVQAKEARFCGFGFKAQKAYLDSQEGDEETELYREFKMQLAGQEKLGRNMIVKNNYKANTSSKRKQLPAIKVFSMALKFLKDNCLQVLRDAHGTVPEKDIRWVLTVPALWTDAQKSFMREAAAEAGLIKTVNSEQLVIALEPECASLYCRSISTHHFQGESGSTALKLPQGAEYVVLDCGGGTIDITVHRVRADGNSAEVYKPSGLKVGGTNINTNFELLMEDLLGEDFVEYCIQKQPAVWLELVVEFEQKKKDVSGDFSKPLDLQVQLGLSDCFQEYHKFNKSLKSHIKSSNSEKVDFTRTGKLRLQPTALRDEIFGPVIEEISTYLHQLFKDPSLSKVKTVFLVGGFGQCPGLQEEVKKLLSPSRRVLIPEEPSLCVLKGAVMFGHRPTFISSRVAQHTYALLVSRAFRPGIDPQRRKRVVQGCDPYIEFLTPIVTKGESVSYNSVKNQEVQPRMAKQTEVDLTIYESAKAVVDDPSDPSVRPLGYVTVYVEESRKSADRKVNVEMTFGGTEIKVRGISASGHTVETKLDLLS